QGVVGGLGLVLLGVALALRAVQHRDRAMAIVLLGIVVLNFFDATLLSGEVIYPLAAVLGWRAVGRRRLARTETGLGSAAAVRVVLAIADAAAGAAAIAVALLVASRGDASV